MTSKTDRKYRIQTRRGYYSIEGSRMVLNANRKEATAYDTKGNANKIVNKLRAAGHTDSLRVTN